MRTRMHFHWGMGMGLSYAVFAVATLAFVTFALRQPVELVSADYYSRALTYDHQIDAARDGDGLGSAVSGVRSQDGRTLIVTLPREHASSSSGTLTLYRPSNVHADRVWPLAVDPLGVQRVSLEGLAQGRWILKIEWQAQGRRYYREQAVHLP